MLNAVDDVRHEMDALYEGFLCTICDGKNHKFVSISKNGKGNLTLNAEWC